MSWSCTIAGHRASAETIYNAGRTFSRCLRCGADLVEEEGQWTTAPKGFRIVWKPTREEDAFIPPSTAPRTEKAIAPAAEPADEIETGFLPLRAQAPAQPPELYVERRGVERRKSTEAIVPTFLNGRDRRIGDRRRLSFGRKRLAS